MAPETATAPFTSNIFEVEKLTLDNHDEWVVRGGRHLFDKLPAALDGVKQIGVIGWGSQGPAQAQNLRDSLEGTDIKVVIGLREGSSSWAKAEAAGFTAANGTLAEMFKVVAESDLVLLLIADAAQVALHKQIFEAMRPGATLGLSHGFLHVYLETVGEDFPDNINVVAVCPKGMGPSVRRLYEQGKEVDGAGINASFAVYRDLDGKSTDRALGWAVGIGSPYIFFTTLRSECVSDIFGERAILLGAVHGIIEALYRRFIELGDDPERAFVRACESLSGPLAKTISSGGMKQVYEGFEGDAKRTFEDSYCATYPSALNLCNEIYEEVASGNEIRSVVLSTERLKKFPMTEVDGSRMWQVGEKVRAGRAERTVDIDPLTAGVFCATMMAQVDLLEERGHPWSEIVNESVIEAVDSLIPYMHSRGVAYMVDNCSTTARLGTRKWGPRFESTITQIVLPLLDGPGGRDEKLLEEFREHPVHDVLAEVGQYRPPVDISVS